MVHRLSGRFCIIDVHARHAQYRTEFAVIDDWRTALSHALDEAGGLPRQPMTEEDQTVRLAPLQHLRITLFAFEVVLRVPHQYGITVTQCRILDALEN